MNKSPEVDAYIAGFPGPVQVRLKKIRAAARKAAPAATELMSYRIPAYKMRGVVFFFAGFQGHIGLFPPVHGNEALQKAVKKYAGPKGNLRLPHDEPLPLPLISRIVRHQVKQDLARAAARKGKR